MGRRTNGPLSNILGWTTFALAAAAALALLAKLATQAHATAEGHGLCPGSKS